MSQNIRDFQAVVWEYYQRHGRDLPWRHTTEPYKILVSEVMLQQTQVARVIPKYQAFINQFPTARALANANLAEVLRAWSGLGYNRRAKYLHDAAKQLADKKMWTLPDLTNCKGIGTNTAAAVITYAYNQPVGFIETNIRTVFIHHFFADKTGVADKEILPLVEQTLDKENPREWFWALMDYGSHLKTTVGNTARASKHYTKQSTFIGSKRQLRGQVLRLLADKQLSLVQLSQVLPDSRLSAILADLQVEGLVTRQKSHYRLPNETLMIK